MTTLIVDVEGIRHCIVSAVVGTAAIRRKAFLLVNNASQDPRADLHAIDRANDEVETAVRALFYLLPEEMRPPHQQPAEPHSPGPRHEEPVARLIVHPGEKLPRKIRWPDWTEEKILEMADAYFAIHGRWPSLSSGVIPGTAGDTWTGIDLALKKAHRGLPGGTTLAKFLAQRRNVRNRTTIANLSIKTILECADAHHARTGKWPTAQSGELPELSGDTWLAVDTALRQARRGITSKTSLSRLLAEHRGVRHLLHRDLSMSQILTWADEFHELTGDLPIKDSGEIPGSPGDTWFTIDNALRIGLRSLEKGSSLSLLLLEHRGKEHRLKRPLLVLDELERCARSHYDRLGFWPSFYTGGEIPELPGCTWRSVHQAFVSGNRGLKGCGFKSLGQFLDARIGKLQRRAHMPGIRVPGN